MGKTFRKDDPYNEKNLREQAKRQKKRLKNKERWKEIDTEETYNK
jgi:hypothetical protein